MKKSILVAILVAIMLIATVGSVNAASVEPSKDTIKAGETVKVTVKAEKAGVNLQFDVEFDATELKFTGVTSATGMTAIPASGVKDGNGTIMVYDADPSTKETTDYATLTFEALKDVEAAEVKVTNFVSEDAEGNAEEVATVGTATIKVEKVEGSKDPVKDPEKDPSGSKDPDKKPDDTKNPTDINGKPIKVQPQMGTPIYMVAIAVIVIAAGAVLAIRKNK